MRISLSLWFVVMSSLSTLPVNAQTGRPEVPTAPDPRTGPDSPTPDDPPLTARTAKPDEIARRLEQVKRDLLPRVWNPKIDQNQGEQKKYLA